MKRPTNRVFEYPPRFYKPEDDERERKKRKLGFSRTLKTNRRKTRSPLIWIILLIIIILVYLKLSGLS
ncbi:MAG: hypothetical protein WB779_03730 [Ignavibacteriaceae bacterium]|jgi:hypothetical protein